jgi:hypothetical protein
MVPFLHLPGMWSCSSIFNRKDQTLHLENAVSFSSLQVFRVIVSVSYGYYSLPPAITYYL